MIVCPLCENAQPAGDTCDVCGRPFGPGLAAPVPVPPAEGLEGTRYEPVAVAGEELPGLEPTGHASDPFAQPDPGLTEDLEPTATAPVDADAPLIPDLERTDAGIPGDEATPFPAVVVCRYCRTEAGPGDRLCARCGMRLPVVAPAAAAPGGEAAGRICGCGVVVRDPAATCPSCGARPR